MMNGANFLKTLLHRYSLLNTEMMDGTFYTTAAIVSMEIRRKGHPLKIMKLVKKATMADSLRGNKRCNILHPLAS
jgi:hypothetical protein